MTALAELLFEGDAECIRLQPCGDDALTIDAPSAALTPDLICRLKRHKAELIALLRVPCGPLEAATQSPREPVLSTATTKCRCGDSRWIEIPIHRGQSVRRDCYRCRRFVDFPLWYGRHTRHND